MAKSSPSIWLFEGVFILTFFFKEYLGCALISRLAVIFFHHFQEYILFSCCFNPFFEMLANRLIFVPLKRITFPLDIFNLFVFGFQLFINASVCFFLYSA